MDHPRFGRPSMDDDSAGDDAAFPTGMRVAVIRGQYDGDRGEVVVRRPDLRPRSVWVRLDQAGTRLLPSYRLNRVTG